MTYHLGLFSQKNIKTDNMSFTSVTFFLKNKVHIQACPKWIKLVTTDLFFLKNLFLKKSYFFRCVF
jgi:hypothetical protein